MIRSTLHVEFPKPQKFPAGQHSCSDSDDGFCPQSSSGGVSFLLWKPEDLD